MGEWWTYSPADFIPFIRDVYVRMFVRLNESVWPAHVAAVAVGVTALWLARRGRGRSLAVALAACWVWVGWTFHLKLYANLNWAGTYFGWAFFVEAALIVAAGFSDALGRDLDEGPGVVGWVGLGVAAFGFAGFPFLAPLVGRPWASLELFGIAPDPTVVATFGFVLAGRRSPWWVLAIPLAWCAVTALTAWVVGGVGGFVTAGVGLVAALLAVTSA